MICIKCGKDVILEGVECPKCGCINMPAEVKLVKSTLTSAPKIKTVGLKNFKFKKGKR